MNAEIMNESVAIIEMIIHRRQQRSILDLVDAPKKQKLLLNHHQHECPVQQVCTELSYVQKNSNFLFIILVAPPPSLQESTPIIPALQSNAVANSYGSGSVAAKIMAKYGFKDGQGLGKKEQGMSIALQVEKTSKRGGRIIHEKELLMAPPISPSPPPAFLIPAQVSLPKEEQSITEMMKAPSKVVLLRVSLNSYLSEYIEIEPKLFFLSEYGRSWRC